ncbi:flagellar biosynthesis anti-sigma factor FlgM [Paramaledivibacter caminithermalis]|jgi:negative regulator of flagellin synthesis FlgM|uniref:Negative regulator of flagellin synthesis n=1 Tax=Paramaledivibacter caminithermalis (strain DSM 15212 / CIP 107654 / DViRD3) TaxID=1121301 RepID=A0A1M6L5E3_PARC5|nr:flagellar biosynthesis anti-sigma factor FlgM [Paramaledivibacter caminithermalis]SHJ66427.1 anti-sigma-28 factor, FlgM family [Paramaledivibacter caminithermalis DSM 15212]
MKIFSNSNIQKVMASYKSKTTKACQNNKTYEAKDKIEISSKAKDFQVAMNAFKNLPDVREEKVADIKKAIASGTYNPSAEEIIDKMFERVSFDKKI